MTAYDDERVISLLKDSVPAPPEAPARVDAVRRLASRQRSYAAVQALGAVASIVLVVGAAAAIARPGSPGGDAVRPVGDPVATMTAAFATGGSARFEMTMRVEAPDPVETVATGVVRSDGDLELVLGAPGDGVPPVSIKVVDGVSYRSVRPSDRAPAGKRWVRMAALPAETTLDPKKQMAELRRYVRDVRYTGAGEVRGTRVALYAGRMAGVESLGGADADFTFALDDEGRLRRMTMSGKEPASAGGASGRFVMTYELFDYGAVTVTAPPAAEVVDEPALRDSAGAAQTEEARELATQCMSRATSQSSVDGCESLYESMVQHDVECVGSYGRDGTWTFRCSDGYATSGTRPVGSATATAVH